MCTEGESNDLAKLSWWKRWLRPPQWRPWKLWTARYKSVCVVATFQTTGRRDPELETLATMIMNSLEFADEPPDPPHIFRRSRRADRPRPVSVAQVPPQRRIPRAARRIEHQPVQLLPQLRAGARALRGHHSPALATVAQVQKWDSAQSEPTLASVRGRILPMLYPEEVWRRSFPNFVGDTLGRRPDGALRRRRAARLLVHPGRHAQPLAHRPRNAARVGAGESRPLLRAAADGIRDGPAKTAARCC